jgi:IS5 family transposase
MPFKFRDARQYKRIRKVIQRQRTIVGRKMSALGLAVQEALGHTLSQAQRLISQPASKKNPGMQGNLIVGARTFLGNPYDGHTLNEQLEQASILMQAAGMKSETAYVDFGYRGVDQVNPGIDIKHRGKFKSMTEQERNMLKRRQAIEPIIGHLKADHRMNRCHLKGADGDSLHTVLCAAGYFHSLVAVDDRQKKGLSFFYGC